MRKTLIPIGLALGLLGAGVLAVVFLLTRNPITVSINGQPRTVYTHAATVGAALKAAGVAIYPGDVVEPPLDASVTSDMYISVNRVPAVRVVDGQATRWVHSRQTSPYAILATAALNLNPGDELWVDGTRWNPAAPAPVTTPRTVEVRRSVIVSVTDETGRSEIRTAAPTVGEALWQAGIQLNLGDEVNPSTATATSPLQAISIIRSRPVTVQVDGRSIQTRTHRTTVGDVLSDVGLVLIGQDYSVPAVDQPLPAEASVRVVRVREAVFTEQETIPNDTRFQAMPELEIDNTRLVQAGAPGLRQRRTRVRYEDGVEISRVVETEGVVVEPTPRLFGYGTKIVIRTTDTADGPIEYWRAYQMYATSYSPSRSGTPTSVPWFGHTRSGKMLTFGMVAIDPRYMPFGTRMYVPGYGFAVAEDTGGKIKGRWIDLGYDDWNYIPWRARVMVYFLTPVPPADQITWIIPATVP